MIFRLSSEMDRAALVSERTLGVATAVLYLPVEEEPSLVGICFEEVVGDGVCSLFFCLSGDLLESLLS